MTIVKHELRQARRTFLIWTVSIGFLMAVCIFLFPEMKKETERLTAAFSSMGVFSAAFGMDRLSFGTLTGFYSIECGNIMCLGGAFFASLSAVGMLSKEEKEGTADFLLTHPVSRTRIVAEKLASVLIMITVMNLILFALTIGEIALIGEEIPLQDLSRFHLAYYLMQIELAGVCFGISAFTRGGSAGIGLGVATFLYFLNLIAHTTKSVEYLKYITPFAFCDGADIVTNGGLDLTMVGIGIFIGAAVVAAAFVKYSGKDVR